MKTNLFEDGIWTENFGGFGTVARGMVLGSVEELAIINGNWLHEAPRSDFAPGRPQLTREADAVSTV